MGGVYDKAFKPLQAVAANVTPALDGAKAVVDTLTCACVAGRLCLQLGSMPLYKAWRTCLTYLTCTTTLLQKQVQQKLAVLAYRTRAQGAQLFQGRDGKGPRRRRRRGL
jgi:hypothetical protein